MAPEIERRSVASVSQLRREEEGYLCLTKGRHARSVRCSPFGQAGLCFRGHVDSCDIFFLQSSVSQWQLARCAQEADPMSIVAISACGIKE